MKNKFLFIISLFVIMVTSCNLLLLIDTNNAEKLSAAQTQYKITFVSGEGEINGISEAYYSVGGSLIYKEDRITACDFPTCTVNINGIQATFVGWILESNKTDYKDYNSSDQVTYIIKEGKLQKGTEYVNASGYWKDGLGDIVLYARFDYVQLPSKLSFVNSLLDVTMSGESVLYIGYKDNRLALDENILNYVPDSSKPKAEQNKTGYNSTFDGWTSDDIKILDSNCNLISGIENYTDDDGKWIHAGDVILYPKFIETPIILKITLSNNGDEDVSINGETTLYVKYLESVIYTDANCTIKYSGTTATKTTDGLKSTFLGWATDKGVIVINSEGNFEASKSGYTDKDSKWTSIEFAIFYAYFYNDAEILKINFVLNDSDAVMTGNTTVFSKFGTNLLYTSEDFTTMATTPTVKKQKIGYTIVLAGWEYNGLLVLNGSGVLQSGVEGISNENGEFITYGEITLTSRIVETPSVYYVEFNASSANGLVDGVASKKLYINYNDNVFYTDSTLTTTCSLPQATKVEYGYDIKFDGWYSSLMSDGEKYIDSDGNFLNSTIFSNGKYIYLSSVTVYAKFEIKATSVKININTNGGEIDYNIIYSAYYDNEFFKDIERTEKIDLPKPIKIAEGYTYKFLGYYLADNETLVINVAGDIQRSVEGYTNIQGIWSTINEINLYAKYEESINLYKIILDATTNGGEILEGYPLLYVKYHTNTMYYNLNGVLQETTIPGVICNKDGYTATFLGYYTQKDGGIQIIDCDLSINKDVLNYTDSYGNWLPIIDTTLYAQFSFKANTYNIKFSIKDNDGDVVYLSNYLYKIIYDTSVVYLNGEQFTGKFSTPTKENGGYNYTFIGWCLKVGDTYIKLINENGEFEKVKKYTCYADDVETFIYCYPSDMELIAYYEKESNIMNINFKLDEDIQNYYCKYGESKVYADDKCENVVNLSQDLDLTIPQEDGYQMVFLGWYTDDNEKVIDNLYNLVECSVVSGGGWNYLGTLILLPKFDKIPNIYVLSLDCLTGNINGINKILYYAEYGTTNLYEDAEKTIKIENIPNATKERLGYSVNFKGWTDGSGEIIINTDGQITIWHWLNNLDLTAVYEEIPNITSINFVANTQCVIDNDLFSVYCKYDGDKIYLDSECQNEVNYPLANKEESGYDFMFLGWYTAENLKVIDSGGNICNQTQVYYNGWKILSTLNLYPKFNQKPKIYKITFECEETKDGYVAYNTNTICDSDILLNLLEVSATKYKKGYSTNLLGWYTDENDSNLLIDTNMNIVYLDGYSTTNGNYIRTEDIVVYPHFEFIPNVYQITIDALNGYLEGTKSSKKEVYIVYDESTFYTSIECENQDEIKKSIYDTKGYDVIFKGYQYGDVLILDDELNFISSEYIFINEDTIRWNIDSNCTLEAKYEFIPKTYVVTFDIDNGTSQNENRTYYIDFGTSYFYINDQTKEKEEIPLCVSNDDKLTFSGYYLDDGTWLIDEKLNLLYNDCTKDNTVKNKNEVCWNIDRDVILYAKYVDISNMVAINLINTQNNYGDRYQDNVIYLDISDIGENQNIYLDIFRNLLISGDKNRIDLENFDNIHYDFVYYGYYTEPEGGIQIIDENNVIDLTKLDNNKIIEKLYAHYEVTPKTFKITFEDGGGNLSTSQNEYYVVYLTKDLTNINGEIKDIPTASKVIQGYQSIFLGYKTEDDILIISYNGEEFTILVNIENYTDDYGNWIIGQDIVLYASFRDDELNYNSTFYNEDGSIFTIIDLDKNDNLRIPDDIPTKSSSDDKEYVFRYWVDSKGEQLKTTSIATINTYFYPYFEEFDKKEIDTENDLIKLNVENQAKVYLADITQEKLQINFALGTIIIDSELLSVLEVDNLTITLVENDIKLSNSITRYLYNIDTYLIKISGTDKLLTNAELKLKITEKDSKNLNSYMVNNNLRNDLTSEIDGEYLNVKLINLSKENIILIANLDVEKQERLGNILTNILKFGGIGLGSLIVLIIFISIIKKIRRSFITTKANKDRKNQQIRQRVTKDKKDSDAIEETNMINLKQQKANEEFLNSLSKNSLLPQKPMQNLNNQNNDTQQLESNQNLSINQSKIKKK